METNIKIQGLKKSLEKLIPGCNIKISEVKTSTFSESGKFKVKGIDSCTYGQFEGDKFIFWSQVNIDYYCKVEVTREFIELSKGEMSLLGRIPDALTGVEVIASSKGIRKAQNISSYISFEQILISKYLRGGHASTYWTSTFILITLRELTFERYEGSKCTSGLIFSSKPDLYLREIEKIKDVEFEKFTNPIILREGFFSKPGSYRYVDGRNRFYLINNHSKVIGVISIKNPQKYTMIDRLSNKHLDLLIDKMPGDVTAHYIGNNDDVLSYFAKDKLFKWSKGHWNFRDVSVLKSILKQFGCTIETTNILSSLLFALSELKMGTVILIPENITILPNTIGVIDSSDIGNELIGMIIGKKLSEILKRNLSIGMLTSDGLTSISKKGEILSCGEIVELDVKFDINDEIKKAKSSNVLLRKLKLKKFTRYSSISGGGRSQAAISVSKFGLGIKVSEDGPIDIYYKGVHIIKF